MERYLKITEITKEERDRIFEAHGKEPKPLGQWAELTTVLSYKDVVIVIDEEQVDNIQFYLSTFGLYKEEK